MSKVNDLLSVVKPDIERIEMSIREDFTSFSSQMDKLLVEILEYGLLSGGKRFRPLLVVLAARMCSGFSADAYKLAVAFEYLHLATLFHDDVIDQADIRRGKPSVYKEFGVSAAILAGDFLHARSMEIVGGYGGSQALDIFCAATRGMVNGEYIQLRNSQNYNQSEEDYFSAIEGKTALLISAAMEIGGIFAGAGDVEREALRQYGTNLGYGFQIADDLLDYLGDEKKTGKAVGNDLAEGKMTLPLIYALQLSSEEVKNKLIDILRDTEKRTQAFAEVSILLEKNGCFSATREKAEECIIAAISSLDLFLPENQNDVHILSGLANYALRREK